MFQFGFFEGPTAACTEAEAQTSTVGKRLNISVADVEERDFEEVEVQGEKLFKLCAENAAGAPSAATSVAGDDVDLVPGVYEGGLKVWECSLDLVRYQIMHPFARRGSKAAAPRVLELGCGHGFPGVIALQQGCHVAFSDFNEDVLWNATAPTIRANVAPELWPNASFYAGDWSVLKELLQSEAGTENNERFDWILTAETLYTPQVADKVYDMILSHLRTDGTALVAAKRYYFGTGGGTADLRRRCESEGLLTCETIEVYETGAGNIRELLRVAHRGNDDKVLANGVK